MSSRPTRRLPSLYFAGPLFSAGERSYNTFLKQQISEYFDVYLPQEDGVLMPDLLDSGMSAGDATGVVFLNDMNAIKRAEVVLILLDGRAVDEGAAFELGIAFALGKRCVGLQTDFRRLAPFGNNPMLTGALSCVFGSVDEMVKWSRAYSAVSIGV